MYSGRRVGGIVKKKKKKQSSKEAGMFFSFLFIFSRELGSNWKQQWGARHMKKNTQLYAAGQS